MRRLGALVAVPRARLRGLRQGENGGSAEGPTALAHGPALPTLAPISHRGCYLQVADPTLLGTRSLATFLVGEGMRDLRQLRNAERAQVTSSRISRDLRAISAAISHRLVSLAGGA